MQSVHTLTQLILPHKISCIRVSLDIPLLFLPEVVLVGPVLSLAQTLHCLMCRTLSDVIQHKAGALVVHFKYAEIEN